MPRTITRFLVILLVLSLVSPAAADYQLGDRDKSILEMKKILRDGEYYTGNDLTNVYNEKMAEKLILFQTINGMKPTGLLDDATIEKILSKKGRPAYAAPKITDENLDAFVFPDMSQVELPQYEDPATPVIFQSREIGYWLYEAPGVRVEIKRISWPAKPLIWFETDIQISDSQSFYRIVNTNAKGKPMEEDPRKIAKEHKAVFAISDDFASYRIQQNRKVGIVIQNGQIISNETYRGNIKVFPNLDVLAFFEDGSMKTFDSDQYTAKEYLAMGVRETFAFGPYLLQDGKINREVLQKNNKYKRYEPRNSLGMIEPGHYVFVTTLGRQTKSEGTYLAWLAYRLKDLGCVEALNLDGGNSVAILFMGDLLNKAEDIDKVSFMTGVREISSLIGVGTYEEP